MGYYSNKYRMTPAERRARARQIVQYREERSLLSKYLEEQEKAEELLRQQEQSRITAENKAREKTEASVFERLLHTGADLTANVVTGAVKGVEGILDFGAGIVGGIGGLFDDDFEDSVKDIIAKDWTGTYIGEPLQEALRYSYLKDGGIIENVASGIGQMLPAVAVAVATGGTSLPAQALSLGTTMVSAGGNATEQAFQEGADYWRGLGYGAASGAVEGLTEKLLGGATSKLFGAGIFDGVVRSAVGDVAEVGIRRVIKDAAGEAIEEGVAELVNPALKSIYKGRDAFSEYGEADYWKGVGQSALVGGLSSVAFGGTVGRAMKTSGRYADVSGALEANESISKERAELENRGRLSVEAEASSVRAERQNLLNIEKVLKKSNDAQRQELIDRFRLDSSFESDGSIKESVIKRLDSMEKGESGYKKEYYSVSMRGNEDVITEDLCTISEKTGVEARVFEGELSEKGQKNFVKTKKALAALNKSGGNNVSFVITEANEAYKGGLVEDRVMYIPADQLEGDDWAGTLVHEFTHFEEGTEEYSEMVKFLQSDELTVDDGAGGKITLADKAKKAVLEKNYGIDKKTLDALLDKPIGEMTEDDLRIFGTYTSELAAHETEIIMGNEGFIDHIIRMDESKGIVKRILMLDRALSGMKDKQARAQLKLVRQAEKLYLKAAENSGNAFIKKMILSQRRELEDETKTTLAFDKKVVYNETASNKENTKPGDNITNGTNEPNKSEFLRRSVDDYGGRVAEIPSQSGRTVSDGDSFGLYRGTSEIGILSYDTEGRVVPNEIIDKIKNTAIKDGKGHPIVVYHATAKTFDAFAIGDIGFHFGNRNQASFRARAKQINEANYICAYLNINSPLIIEKDYMNWHANAVALHLWNEGIFNDSEKDMIVSLWKQGKEYDSPAATKVREILIEKGYDGIAYKNEYEGEGYSFIAFDNEQIVRIAEDKKDIKFNLKERDPMGDFFAEDNDGGAVYELSGGKVQKIVADNTRMKVYTRAEAEAIVNQIVAEKLSFGELYGSIAGKSKREVIDILWNGLNSADVGQQGKVALDVAEYIINSASVESIYGGGDLSVHEDTVAALKPYLHSMDLTGDIKAEMKNSFGKDNSPYLLWNKRRGQTGMTVEQVKAELAEVGFRIDAESPIDILREIHSAYRNAISELKKESKAALNSSLSTEEQKKLKQDIAREILDAFSEGGSPSKFAGIVNRYIKEANVWREKYRAERKRNEAINSTLKKVQKLKNLKTDAFLNASQHKSHLFKGSIEKLAAIESRGNLNKSGTRRIVGELAEWYMRDNPVLEGRFDEEIEAMLYVISHGKGELSTDEVAMLGDVVDYFSHFVENYNKVYRQGKLVDAKEEAERYVKLMVENSKVKVGWFGKASGSAYIRIFGDPMTVARRMDMYQSGFYTEMMEQLREGAIGASVMEMDMRKPLEAFFEKNKRFLQTIRERKVKYGDFEMTAGQAMLYYMTLNREQAQAGLAKSGFAYRDGDKTVRVPGFLSTENMDAATQERVFQLENLKPYVKTEQAKLYDQFTDAEKKFISIAEKIFNEDCKDAKRKTDMLRKGFSNALESYYVPIRRGNIAKSVDSGSFFDEISRASNASFNKDTIRGAKNELIIDSLDSVLDRHIRGVAQYANLATVIDSYDTIFNLAINDDPNKPESVRTTGVNVWKDGEEYFKRMISDIQGIPVESHREGYQLIRQLRSGYAKYQLGANPKVWFTQLSSFCASGSILDVDCIIKGVGIDSKDVDKYCALAELRNSENTVAMAQGLFDEHSKPGKVLESTGKFGDVLMTPIGWVDRFVVTKLFGACQVQIEKQGGAKVGTVENKTAAGELLQKVILETQQNATATDKSAAMRSGNELMKTITMFTSDSMKVAGRVIDSLGEYSVLKARIRIAEGQELAALEKRLAEVKKQAARSVGSLVSSAVFMACIAQLFRHIYNKDEEDENVALNVAVDAAGNLIGGLPIFKDVIGFFMDGYDIDNYAYAAINDLLESAGDVRDIAVAIAEGKLEGRDLTTAIKRMTYAAGQVLGLPTRNAYNVVYGLIKRFSPETAYKIDDSFYKQAYRSDLTRAIERGDEDMISTIAGLMLNENIGGIEDEAARVELDRLLCAEFDVIPRGVADTITYDEVEYSLTAAEKKEFKKIYSVANEALAELVGLSQYRSASDEVKAKAINYIYKVYWDLALQDFIGEDLETKTVLFAEAIPVEKLALIVATAATLTSDTDKNGKSISGSRKKKVQEYVNSLNLKAVEKYMVMGYLGYKNAKGEAQVKAYINKLKLTKSEKDQLLKQSGY